MNYGTLGLTILFSLLILRASYYWFVEEAGQAWYRKRGCDWGADASAKPWYVRRYDRMWARRRTS